MSYTGNEIFSQSIALIDELSETGTVSDAQIKEYKYRAPSLLDLWQHEYAKRGTLFNTVEIPRKPMSNLLGNRFDSIEHFNADLTYETVETASSFHFKVDNECSVYVEEYVGGVWANASGYYTQDDGTETAFTGLITITALTIPSKIKGTITATGTKTRFRFAGSYHYQFYNFALYKAAFPTCARVPDYGEYIRYATPANFNTISQITEENPKCGLFHKWENSKDLLVRYDFEGVIKLTYKPTPVKITALTQTLEINESSAISGAHYLAKYWAISDQNTELANVCSAKYKELKNEDTRERPSELVEIIDVYGSD